MMKDKRALKMQQKEESKISTSLKIKDAENSQDIKGSTGERMIKQNKTKEISMKIEEVMSTQR